MVKIVPGPSDALIVVDVQRDFLPAGTLGDAVRAVEVSPGDDARAIAKMEQACARLQAP